MNTRLLIPLALAVSACGGPSDLAPDAVRSIPDGDGTGSALGGDYAVELRTVDFSGSCGPFVVGIFTASVCDVGDVVTEHITVEQREGHLVIDTSDLPSRFEGGAYDDASFDVGGYATEFGGAIEITARSLGRIDESGRIEATVRSRTWGDFEGQSADCYGVREVSGARE